MKLKSKAAFLLATLFAAGSLLAQNSRALEAQFKAAQHKAEIEGDLKSAIEQFKKIAEAKGADRTLAAKAALAMADSHRKLGDAQAQKIYEDIPRRFADQPGVVAEAQARLKALLAAQVSNSVQTRELIVRDYVRSTISPDGRYMVGSNRGLYDQVTDTYRSLNLQGIEYAFSGDGTRLAYSVQSADRSHGELRVGNLQSNGVLESRTLLANPDVEQLHAQDWTADGRSIVLSIMKKDGSSEIGLVSVADGAYRKLKAIQGFGPDHIFVNPADANYVALDLQANGTNLRRDVVVLALDGSPEQHVAVEPGAHVVMGWSPDGGSLLIASDHPPFVDLQAVPFANGKVQGVPRLIRSNIGRVDQAMGVTSSGTVYYRLSIPPARRVVRIANFDFNANQLSGSSPSREIIGAIPEWSRDGRYYAHRTYTPRLGNVGTDDLTIRAAEDDRIVRQLPLQLNGFVSFRWSADGESFLVSGKDLNDRVGIYRVDSQTGEATPLILDSSIGRSDWSADEKNIFYQRRVWKSPTDFSFALLVRDLASGRDKELFNSPLFSNFALSPDGQHIAFRSANVTSVMPSTGGEPRPLARGGFVGWLPDSGSVLVSSLEGEVQRVSLEGQSRKLSLPNVSNLSVSPDGRTIALELLVPTTGDRIVEGIQTTVRVLDNLFPRLGPVSQPQSRMLSETFQMAWIDQTGRQIEKLGMPGDYGWPVFSPDGTAFAISRGEARGSDIWIFEFARGSMRRLTSGANRGQENLFPTWSPDGARMAFLSNRNGKFALYVKRVDGTGNEELLLDTPISTYGRGISWSPDGRFIVYAVDDPNTGADLWAVPVNGDRPVPVVHTLFSEMGPQVSPDGKWLAYVSVRNRLRQVYVRSFPDGAREWQVPVPGLDVFGPRWRADSNELYVSTGGGTEMAVEIRTSGNSIQFGVPQIINVPWGAISIDGRRFLGRQPMK